MDSRLLLLRKEQELNQIRETALLELEARYAAKEQEYNDLLEKFDVLQADFEYNIQLLEGRDAELCQYDIDASEQAAALADSARQVAELQESLNEAQKELKAEKAARQEEAFLAQANCQELHQQLEDTRASSAEQMLCATEQYEHNKRVLQRALAEAEEEVARQRREMGAEFQSQAQQLELKYRQQAEDAQQEANVAKTLAQQRETEARAAHVRELDKIKATEAALSAARRHEQAAAALTWELESMQRLKDDAIAELQQQCATLRQQLQAWSEEADQQQGDLSRRLASSNAALEQVRASAAAAATQAESRHAEELATLRHKLQMAQCHVTSLETELSDAQAALLVSQKEGRDKALVLEQELHLKAEACEEALAEADQKHKSEMRQLKETLWARDEELRVMQEKVAGLKKTLGERRADINTYKEQLVASGERERAIQRQLMAAEMRLEEAHEVQAANSAMEHEGLTKHLLEQRNTANAALQDVQQRVLAKEAEARYLRDHLAANLPPAKSSAVLAAAAAAGAAASVNVPSSPRPAPASTPTSVVQKPQPQSMDVFLRQARQQQQGPSRLTLSRPPQLATQPPDVSEAQPYDGLAAPSPSATPIDLNLPSPPSSAAFWAGVLGPDRSADLGSAWSPRHADINNNNNSNNNSFFKPTSDNQVRAPGVSDNSAAQAASAAAARAAAFLSSSKEGIQELLRSPNSPGRPLYRIEGGDGGDVLMASPDARTSALQAAFSDIERQNMQLRATLGMMREEMEALQQAAAAAAAAAANTTHSANTDASHASAPGAHQAALDVLLLKAELQESDRDLQQALQHVEVLQRQLHLASSPARTPQQAQALQQQRHGSKQIKHKQHAQDLQGNSQSQQSRDLGAQDHDLEQQVQSEGDSGSLQGETTAGRQPSDELEPVSPTTGPGSVAAGTLAAGEGVSAAPAGPRSLPLTAGEGETGVQSLGSSELLYLQRRVRELMLQNRELRRQALQLKLSLEQVSTSPAQSRAGEGSTGDLHTTPQPPPQTGPQQNLSGFLPASPGSNELARATRRITQLQQENELLMDMSSALRAERDRLSVQLATLSAAPPPPYPSHPQLPFDPAHAHPEAVQQQQLHNPHLPHQATPGHHHQLEWFQLFQGVNAAGEGGPGAPHAVLWPPHTQHPPQLQHHTLPQHQQRSQEDHHHQYHHLPSPSQQPSQGVQHHTAQMGQPSAQRAAAAAAAAAAAHSPRMSHVVGGADQQARVLSAPSQQSPTRHQQEELIPPPKHTQHHPASGSFQPRLPSNNTSSQLQEPEASQQQQQQPPLPHPQYRRQHPSSQEQPPLQGQQQELATAEDARPPPAPPYVPASAVPRSASSRETASQKAKLRALQQRRDPAPTDAAGPSMPRVRNYNVQSDNDWKAALRAMAIAGVTPSVSS